MHSRIVFIVFLFRSDLHRFFDTAQYCQAKQVYYPRQSIHALYLRLFSSIFFSQQFFSKISDILPKFLILLPSDVFASYFASFLFLAVFCYFWCIMNHIPQNHRSEHTFDTAARNIRLVIRILRTTTHFSNYVYHQYFLHPLIHKP